MRMPDTPLTPSWTLSPRRESPPQDSKLESASTCKKRERLDEVGFHPGPPLKRMFTRTEAEIARKYSLEDVSRACEVCGTVALAENSTVARASSEPIGQLQAYDESDSGIRNSYMLSPNHRRVVTREFMQTLVNETLRSGHPTSEVHIKTELGEAIEITNTGSRGEMHERKVFLNIESSVPEVIITEEYHLQFALQKIVDNAIKFTDDGTITITVKLAESLQTVEIWVVDTGCGMTEESKTNIFKPHFQENPSTSRPRDGLGLSLFNAKAHVRKNLGGDVTLERTATAGPSKGSAFLVRLPISSLAVDNIDAPLVGSSPPPSIQRPLLPSASSDSKVITGITSSRTRAISPALASQKAKASVKKTFNPNLASDYPLNILIAEDNAINRSVIITSLSRLGYAAENVTVAFDGAEAVHRYRESVSKPIGEQFDVILMDIWMPKMDGYEATKEILELSFLSKKSTKIIAVTADITGECLERAEASGMHGFLAKPYKVLDIEQLIVQHFGKVE